MPGSHSPVTLRLEPQALPVVRAAFDEAITEIGLAIRRLRSDALIPEPWLGDQMSAAVHQHYVARVMEAPDGPYAAVRAFEAELIKVRDNLQLLEDHYRRTEGDNAALWGRA